MSEPLLRLNELPAVTTTPQAQVGRSFPPAESLWIAPSTGGITYMDAQGRVFTAAPTHTGPVSTDPYVPQHLPSRSGSPTLSIRAPQDDPLVLEGSGMEEQHRPTRPSSAQDASEAESEVPEPYLRNLNSAFQIVYDTLPESFCPRPLSSLDTEAETATERLARQLMPERVAPSKRSELRLPICPAVKLAMQKMEAGNHSTPIPWSAPPGESRATEGAKSFRYPAPDPETGLDLSKTPPLDASADKAKLSKPPASSSVSLPYGFLETWEQRERKSLGIASQLDFLAATALQKCADIPDGIPDDLRTLLIYLARGTYTLSMNTAASMTEMLRIRREAVLATMPAHFIMEPGINRLRTAPLSSNTLFDDRVPTAVSSDREDQLHANLARGNQPAKPSPFKRPAKQADAVPTKKKKEATYQRSPIPSPPPGPQRTYPKPKGRGKFHQPGKGGKPPAGRGGPPKGQP